MTNQYSNPKPAKLPLFTGGTIVEIPLNRGYAVIVDIEDSDLKEFKWHVTGLAKYQKIPYAIRQMRIGEQVTKVQMHRIIMERILGRKLVKGEMVDHIDGNSLNNSRSNLRVANASQNQFNAGKRIDNKSGYKGVSYSSDRHKWVATIRVNGKTTCLGRYNSAEAAYSAYCEAAKKYHGEFFNPG